MLRTLLLAFDADGLEHAATRVAMEWALQHQALLVGLGIIDESAVNPREAVPLGGGQAKRELDAARLEAAYVNTETVLSELAQRCAAQQVSCKLLEGVGHAAEQIAEFAQRYDLIVAPRWTARAQHAPRLGLASSLWDLLHAPPRPVVAVPEQTPDGSGVLIAYDGSLQAARTLQAWQQSGLLAGSPVHVLAVEENRVVAAKTGELALDYLNHHKVQAKLHVETSGSPGEIIVRVASELDVALVVMGAYGQARIRDLILGSATNTVLTACSRPLFLYH
ncbi:MAG: universal stress protein [Pirellulales bacterium]|nr:universal stress protein [Pirellulales bacterium]